MTCGIRYRVKKSIAKTRPPINRKKVGSIFAILCKVSICKSSVLMVPVRLYKDIMVVVPF